MLKKAIQEAKSANVLKELNTSQKKLGDCYRQAYNYFMANYAKNKNLRLVHGLVTGQGEIEGVVYNHAWIEDGNYVIDTTVNLIHFPKEVYYHIGKIKESNVFRYNYDEVIKKILKYKTYGPWERKLLKNKY